MGHCLLVIHLHYSGDVCVTPATLGTQARDTGDERHLRPLRAPPLLHLKEGAAVLLLKNLDGAGGTRPGAVRPLER